MKNINKIIELLGGAVAGILFVGIVGIAEHATAQENCGQDQISIDGACVDRVPCEGGTVSDSNECTCLNRSHRAFMGVCAEPVPCVGGNLSSSNTCRCPGSQRVFSGICAEPAACVGGVLSENNVCECSDGQDLVDGSCRPPCDAGLLRGLDGGCAANCGANEILRGGRCACAENFERAGDICLAPCDLAQVRIDGACVARVQCEGGTVSDLNICQCPDGQENVEGTCRPPCGANEVRHPSGECGAVTPLVCASMQQRFDSGICVPLAASDSRNSSLSSGAAVAMIALPAVLGVYAVGLGVGFVDPSYDLSWSGTADSAEWTATGGANFKADGMSSYVSARSSGESVRFSSGAKYEGGMFGLSYDASEYEGAYEYSMRMDFPIEFGIWEARPIAEIDLEYHKDGGGWESESSLGMAAAWAASRWEIKAKSTFAFGGGSHQLNIERRF